VSNTPNRDQLAQALSADYGDFHGRIVDQLDRVDALRATRGQFLEARRALDSVLDDELQPAIVEARAAKRADVTSLTTMTEWLQSGFTALAVVLAAAIGVYLVRSERGLQAKQRQLQQANRTKSDFLANMSHEIRTPMNAVLGMARLMERTELNSQQQDYLQKIRRSSENLLGIINDILDFSRIEADKLTLEDVSFELDEVLSDVANMAGLRAEEKGLELVYRIDPGVPLALRGDPLRLSQILLNLVNNAVKFTERGTVVISVACRQDDGDQVVLDVSVRDSGVGMSPEEQERLFQAFTQADTSTTRRFGGTGLGLAIVSHLVERMGGTVSIDSAPGEGTTFSFTLQLERAGDSPVSAQAADVPLNDRHALVVDDVAINREVLKDILQSWSFRVEEADSAEAAIEKEQEARRAGAPFSLILMDWKLPGLDGLAASERILSHHQDQRPLVLMVTAHDRGNLGQRADEVGIPAVLKKPFTPSTLYNAIASASGETVATAQARPAAEAQLPRFPGLRVLVAEDNAINSQVVEELLTEAGASVTLAGNGREAVEQLDNATFDAVLMDAQMPELDGYEATRQLRRDERHANLPIIAMTAHAMAGDRERCLEAGMNEYLSKPIDEAQLFNVLAQCVPASLVEWPGDAAPDDQPAPPPAQPTPPTDESPTRLPGIDLDQGLKRVGGKRELLHRQLRLFREQYADAPEILTHHLEQGDDEAAAAYAHALKGAAGVLGINAVADAAARVETACRDDAAEDARSALSAFTDALRTACESIDTGLPETPGHASSANSSQGGSIQDAAPLCRDLLDKLKRNDLSAEASLTTLRDALTEHGVDDRLEALRTQIERLEFSQAQTTLTSLMRALGVEESSDD
jgi:signal transduction histidine kinase/DNA-binding response OmpR family regulator